MSGIVNIHFTKRAHKYNKSSNWVCDNNLINKIFELSGASQNSNVLDIATGTGILAERFYTKVSSITGLDICKDMTSYASKCVNELVVGDAEDMPFNDDSFDICICRQGLQFMNLDSVLPEIYRVLKPGGVVVLCHLNAYNPVDKDTFFKILRLRNPARKNFFLPEDIPNCLQKINFKDIYSDNYESIESINKWANNGAIPEDRVEAIKKVYHDSSDEFKKIHKLEINDKDVLDSMLLTIVKAVKP